MKISDHEKQLILIIDEQVQLLRSKEADDSTIVNTLIEFTAEARCIMGSIDKSELEPYLDQYKNFAYYVSLIEQVMN